ncbi:MAG: hypothetical protein AB7N54_13155 [Alphaproteobacteria bacterium]
MDDSKPRCGVPTKSGRPCRHRAGRCPVHVPGRAARSGPRPARPGVYSAALTPEEAARWQRVPVGSLNGELRLARLRLARIAAAEQRLLADDPAADTRQHAAQIDHLTMKIERLEQRRAKLRQLRRGIAPSRRRRDEAPAEGRAEETPPASHESSLDDLE